MRQGAISNVGDKFNIRPSKSGQWYYVSRYYTVVKGQPQYYYGDYETDYRINCQNDCFKTADGTDLHYKEPFTVLACPRTFPLGTVIELAGIGTAVCHDRGGAIKDKRLDLWVGAGLQGLWNVLNTPSSGWREIKVLYIPE